MRLRFWLTRCGRMTLVAPMYEWLKVVHILAVISWMAGLLYLPRLMVYHTASAVGSEQDETFKIMERRLLKAIMRPAALVALISGAALIHFVGFGVWLAVKLVAVVLMFGAHGVLEKHVGVFGRGLRLKSGRYFRILNEVPTVLMIVIVIMVVVKPFS
jgi:protoporphyrinogen IX oxidase